tara:strand:+ start:298 stop:480 length:183 start_codon:yes stop_codon:yes gene_type:complete
MLTQSKARFVIEEAYGMFHIYDSHTGRLEGTELSASDAQTYATSLRELFRSDFDQFGIVN